MPYRQKGSFRRRGMGLRPVNSMKNHVISDIGISSTQTNVVIAEAVDSATLAVANAVEKSCTINNVYVIIDVCGLGGTGVLNVADFYIIKNPGNNLTIPNPRTWGTSNEKKFIFKTWRFMIMRNQDGNMPFHWEGWVKLPKIYRRFGAANQLQLAIVCSAAVTGHATFSFLYKWYK